MLLEQFSLLDAVTLGLMCSIITEVLKNPALDIWPLKYIKTGKIAIFVVCILSVAIYAFFTGKLLFTDWQNLLKAIGMTLASAFVIYSMVIKQIAN
jgi:hypothetical protein